MPTPFTPFPLGGGFILFHTAKEGVWPKSNITPAFVAEVTFQYPQALRDTQPQPGDTPSTGALK